MPISPMTQNKVDNPKICPNATCTLFVPFDDNETLARQPSPVAESQIAIFQPNRFTGPLSYYQMDSPTFFKTKLLSS